MGRKKWTQLLKVILDIQTLVQNLTCRRHSIVMNIVMARRNLTVLLLPVVRVHDMWISLVAGTSWRREENTHFFLCRKKNVVSKITVACSKRILQITVTNHDHTYCIFTSQTSKHCTNLSIGTFMLCSRNLGGILGFGLTQSYGFGLWLWLDAFVSCGSFLFVGK